MSSFGTGVHNHPVVIVCVDSQNLGVKLTRRTKILGVVLGVLATAVLVLAAVLGHDSACEAPGPLPQEARLMKAIVYRCYGPPEVLALENTVRPAPADDEVLVRVRAAAVNPLDWHFMRGQPYFMRLMSGIGKPKDQRFGVDFAGTVEAVGRNVTRFRPGDDVLGGASGALAEYLTVREDRALVLKPGNITFEEAAAVPVAAITALQALRDKGKLKPGQRVLVNGASGGVGTFAVQIARLLGAEVTGVCSTRNVDLVRSIGADHVVDYTQEDFTEGARRYDVIVDNVGNHPLLALRRVLNPDGIVVMVGGSSGDNWIGPLLGPIWAAMLSPFVSQTFAGLLARLKQDDLRVLAEMLEAGSVQAVIDRRYPLAEVPAAIAYLEEGRARGKVVISVETAAP
jgi:NADPH:quinone reductase-like Zn-dependent oxidoreductase